MPRESVQCEHGIQCLLGAIHTSLNCIVNLLDTLSVEIQQANIMCTHRGKGGVSQTDRVPFCMQIHLVLWNLSVVDKPIFSLCDHVWPLFLSTSTMCIALDPACNPKYHLDQMGGKLLRLTRAKNES